VTDPDIQRVQAEARALVRAQALARAQHVAISGRDVSDFVRSDRVEGLAVGEGLSKRFGHGVSAALRARYGVDDEWLKGSGTVSWEPSSTFGLRLFGLSDFRDAGDVAERSRVVNSVASQEFGSDYTDPYRVRGGGFGFDVSPAGNARWQLDASIEQQNALSVHARPVVGTFEPTIPAWNRRLAVASLRYDRRTSPFVFGTELTMNADSRATWDLRPALQPNGTETTVQTARGSLQANIERPFGANRIVSQTMLAGVWSSGETPPQELVYFGGPVSGPGYDYHSLQSTGAVAQHLELQIPIPFPAFSLGRFGRVPASGTFAPYVHAVATFGDYCNQSAFLVSAGPAGRCTFGETPSGFYPSIGAAILSPFNLLRIDVARGLGHGGRWTFNIDVSREFWRIL